MITRRAALLVTMASFLPATASAQVPQRIVLDRRANKSGPRDVVLFAAGEGGLGTVVAIAGRLAADSPTTSIVGSGFLLSRLDGGTGYELRLGGTPQLARRMGAETNFVIEIALDPAPVEAAMRVFRGIDERQRYTDHATAMALLARTARAAGLNIPASAPHPAAFVRGLPAVNP